MESSVFTISLHKNPAITMEVTPGHFATGHFHTNYYLNVSNLKTSSVLAGDVARELAVPYLSSTLVDTIVCMDRTEVVGAYLAEELFQQGTAVMNSGQDVNIITPMTNTDGKLMFQDNLLEKVCDRRIILLVDSISSGQTINGATECLNYYGGVIVGTSALFSTIPEYGSHHIHAMFTQDDVPDYRVYSPGDCVLCKGGRKLDAIINNEGYTKI